MAADNPNGGYGVLPTQNCPGGDEALGTGRWLHRLVPTTKSQSWTLSSRY
jgi:hypothetical protein